MHSGLPQPAGASNPPGPEPPELDHHQDSHAPERGPIGRGANDGQPGHADRGDGGKRHLDESGAAGPGLGHREPQDGHSRGKGHPEPQCDALGRMPGSSALTSARARDLLAVQGKAFRTGATGKYPVMGYLSGASPPAEGRGRTAATTEAPGPEIPARQSHSSTIPGRGPRAAVDPGSWPATSMRLRGIVARALAVGAHECRPRGRSQRAAGTTSLPSSVSPEGVCGALSGIRQPRPHALKYSVWWAGRGTFPSFLGMPGIPG